MEKEKESIIDVDFTTKKEFIPRLMGFFINPIIISLLIVLLAAGALFLIISVTRPPDVPAKEKAIGDLVDPKAIVEVYEDLQCPVCQSFQPTFEQLMDKYKDQKVKFVFRHFPISRIHPHAEDSAEASEYANENGKFWEFQKMLYASLGNDYNANPSDLNPPTLTRDNLVKMGESLGLNGAEMRAKIDSGAYRSRISAELDEGTKRGVTGTPTIYINNKEFIVDANAGVYRDANSISKVIDVQLAQ